MKPRSSNLPQVHLPSVGLILAGEVLLEVAHQVLEHIHVLPSRAHHPQALHELGAVLGGQFLPISLARVGDQAAPATRRAISV